jgi:hypothetical protein
METFDFPYFTWAVKYPESSAGVKFGRGWEFTTAPKGPDQVTYTLKFKTMVFFTDEAGRVIPSVRPEININRLEKFYQRHRLWKRFKLPLPGHGTMIVRFSKPLDYALAEDGKGTVEPFQLEILTQP